jgi:hypothetical protein
MNLPPDVVAYVHSHFPAQLQEAAFATLLTARLQTGELPETRLLRCAVIASERDLLRLQYYVGLLAIDWRDVIVAGEYSVREEGLVKVRDLCEPIPPNEF